MTQSKKRTLPSSNGISAEEERKKSKLTSDTSEEIKRSAAPVVDISDPMFLASASSQYCCIGFPCLHFSLNVGERTGRSFGDARLNGDHVIASSFGEKQNQVEEEQSPGSQAENRLTIRKQDLSVDSRQNKVTAKQNQSITIREHEQLVPVDLVQQYTDFCDLYRCPPNAGILIAIRFNLPTLRISKGDSFHDSDVLALVEFLLHNDNCNNMLRHVRRIDLNAATAKRFERKMKGFGSHGAFTISKLLQKSEFIEELFISRNRIGPYGAAAIFLAASKNSTLTTIIMRKCQISEQGALAFREHILKQRSRSYKMCRLKEIDLSCNRLGHIGIKIIDDCMKARNNSEGEEIKIDLDGNLPFQEILNGVTHGLGLLVVFVGTILLSNRVKNKSLRHNLGCTIYNFSLLLLYTSSTLYHSFFYLKLTRNIFHVFDRCAIYILISGTYTPFLMIGFPDNIIFSGYILAFIWACGICGIIVDATCVTWKHKGKFSLSMYLMMGWASVIVVPEFKKVFPIEATNLIIIGGLLYTAGVPFFVRNTNLDHSIWHVFVLAASICHWMAVYQYVALFP